MGLSAALMTKRTRQVIGSTFLLLAGCANSSYVTPLPEPPRPVLAELPPAAEREFRGVWVTTIDNRDWPSRPGLPSNKQKEELIAILDRAVQLHLNAVLLQVRPCCDALYDSKIEPWSEYLTGKMGVPPSPFYDPLAFAVEQAHKRGLELHAWINPFRARAAGLRTPVAANFVTRLHPDLVRDAGGYLMLDPSDPRAREYTLGVILDIVRRYDIDGLHMDDYFYPYPERGYNPDDFPDDVLWQKYLRAGGKLSRGDWRRDNINTFVRDAYASIKKEKPWVKFGISPFGIWRPGHPAQIAATLDSYEALFADSQKWFASGWVDYLSPQLYWPTTEKDRSFSALLDWWGGQNTQHRHLWPGLRAGVWDDAPPSAARETGEEIALTRGRAGASGGVLFRAGFIMGNTNGVADELARTYPAPALVPASPWLGGLAPTRPAVTVRKAAGGIAVDWASAGGGAAWQWFLQEKTGDHWTAEILPRGETSRLFRTGTALPRAIALTAVTRTGVLSPPAVSVLPPR